MPYTHISLADDLSTYIPPATAPPFLRRLIVTTLLRRGFDSAEAGALAEMERLVLHHIEHTVEEAKDYANLCGRIQVHAGDIVKVQEDSGWGVKGMRKETKRKRKALRLDTIPSPPMSPYSLEVTLPDLLRQELQSSQLHDDIKPLLRPSGNEREDAGNKLPFAEEWLPALPDKWTYALPQDNTASSKPDHPQISASLLDFIKLTAAERGDIPPELGLVDYRRQTATGPGMTGGKRRWGVGSATR
nr:hypothetical protein L203_04537 [Cryptococcus depauperatus CBS 7841]